MIIFQIQSLDKYTDSYDSFEEFKEEFSDYIEYYLNSY